MIPLVCPRKTQVSRQNCHNFNYILLVDKDFVVVVVVVVVVAVVCVVFVVDQHGVIRSAGSWVRFSKFYQREFSARGPKRSF